MLSEDTKYSLLIAAVGMVVVTTFSVLSYLAWGM
jgi:hypothetical protein